ncbi:MAG: hypothetical protein RIC07_09575 [Coleofasciculus sp. E1-EBD-02]
MQQQIISTTVDTTLTAVNALAGGSLSEEFNTFREGMDQAGLCVGICDVQRESYNALRAKRTEYAQKQQEYQTLQNSFQSLSISFDTTHTDFGYHVSHLHSFSIIWKTIRASNPSSQQLEQIVQELELQYNSRELSTKIQELQTQGVVSLDTDLAPVIETLQHVTTALALLDGVAGLGALGISLAASIRAFSIASKVIAFGDFLSPAGWVLTAITLPIGMILNAMAQADESEQLSENIAKLDQAIHALHNLQQQVTAEIEREHQIIDLLETIFPPIGNQDWGVSMAQRSANLSTSLSGSANTNSVDRIISQCVSRVRFLTFKEELLKIVVEDYLVGKPEFEQKFYQELIQMLEQLGIEITPQVRDELHQKALQQAIEHYRTLIDREIRVEKDNSFAHLEKEFPNRTSWKTRAAFDQHISDEIQTIKDDPNFSHEIETFKNDHHKMEALSQEIFSEDIKSYSDSSTVGDN